MARRKVTMLDAFKVSARESQERLLTERRRLAAEREKEARRDEASRSASEWGRRLGEGVGSWWSQIWGADDRLMPLDRLDGSSMADHRGGASDVEDPGPAAGLATDGPSGGASGDDSDEASGGASGAGDRVSKVPATPIDRRPARVSSWEAPESTANVVAEGAPNVTADSGGAAPGDGSDEPPYATSDGPGSSAALATSDRVSAVDLDLEEFSLPMSGRSFSVLLAVALATVFGLGILLGGGSKGVEAGDGGASGSAKGAAEDRRAGLSFAGGPSRGRSGGPRAGASGSASGSAPGSVSAGINRPGGAGLDRGEGAVASAPPLGSSVDAAPDAGADPDENTPADNAFLDPAMKYTVMAITYSLTEANIELAFEAYYFLASKGFPVVRPMPHGERLFIFVGAEEAAAALDDLLLDLRSLKVPPSNRTEFRSAYPVNIATYR